MGTATTTIQTNNQLKVDYDFAKIFLSNIEVSEETPTYTNGTGSEVTLKAGTPMGRITASGKVTPLASAANDGSQYCVGVLIRDYTVANAADQEVTLVVAGEVRSSFVEDNLDGSDTLDTVVTNNGGRRIRDVIQGDTAGIVLKNVTDNMVADNS